MNSNELSSAGAYPHASHAAAQSDPVGVWDPFQPKRQPVRHCPGGQRTGLYPVILDRTKVHQAHVLFDAVPRKKRALPLAYGVYHPQRLRKSQNHLERGMLTLVNSLLPRQARLVVLAMRVLDRRN